MTVRSQERMLQPCREYGEPHEDNGQEGQTDAFYFVLAGTPDEGGRVSGYVTFGQFNWLASRLGLPPLTNEPCWASCGEARCALPKGHDGFHDDGGDPDLRRQAEERAS